MVALLKGLRMAMEPTMLPTKDVESSTPFIRGLSVLTMIAGVLGGATIAFLAYKGQDWTTFGIGIGIAVQSILLCLVLLAFAANSENMMAIARSQEIANGRLLEIRKAVEKQADHTRQNSQA